jgi:hypothetical protein
MRALVYLSDEMKGVVLGILRSAINEQHTTITRCLRAAQPAPHVSSGIGLVDAPIKALSVLYSVLDVLIGVS